MHKYFRGIAFLGLSAALHLVLLFNAGNKGGFQFGNAEANPAAPVNTIRAHLITYEAELSQNLPLVSNEGEIGDEFSSVSSIPPTTSSALQNSTSEAIKVQPVEGSIAPPENYYFRVDELTERPAVIQDVNPVLTYGISEIKLQTPVLHLLINEAGEVDDVLVEDEEISQSDYLLLRSAFKEARFTPGKINAISVKSRLSIEIRLEEIPPAS